MPQQREIAKKYNNLELSDINELLSSPVHEERLVALLILIEQYKKSGEKIKKCIYDFYISKTARINNWDLVDLTAHHIVGDYLKNKDKSVLYSMARSQSLWERRIAIIATFAYIKDNDFDDALAVASLLLNDEHDLIHKAVGWMLREIGKRDASAEERFLKKHYKTMPRTMLRYAIERFDERKRRFYMKK